MNMCPRCSPGWSEYSAFWAALSFSPSASFIASKAELKKRTSRLLIKPSVALLTSPSERRSRASLRLIRASCPQPCGLTPMALSKIAPGDFVAALRRPVWQRGFRTAPVFDGLQPQKWRYVPVPRAACRKTEFFDRQLCSHPGVAPALRFLE